MSNSERETPSQEQQQAVAEKTKSMVIWDAIKDLKVNYFGMQLYINVICTPMWISPTELYLKLKSSAALPFIEQSLNDDVVNLKPENKTVPKFLIELRDKYAVVTNNPELLHR